jgi:hypothetical protein
MSLRRVFAACIFALPFAAFAASDTAKWAKLIKERKITIE